MKSAHSYRLTSEVFAYAEKMHGDLMEPWSGKVAEARDAAERQSIMREALAATFRQRYPMPPGEAWPANPVPALPPTNEKTTHA